MKKYSFSVLLFALCMLVTATGAATTIVAPGYPHGEILPPGSTGVFPVSVGDLTDVQGVHFNLTFDSTLLSVESISASNAIPGSSVTTNIDNETGWVQVAVTNTEGINVGDWPLTPLVDITFRSTGIERESALRFSGTPTYSQSEDFVPEEFYYVYNGSIAVRNPSTFWAPSGKLASGQSGTFAVGVDNLTGATKIGFELMYDGSYLIIDDIVSVYPGAVITDAEAINGIFSEHGPYELREFGLESVPEEMRQHPEQTHHHHNWAWVTVEIPDGLTVTEYTEIIGVTFRSTNLAGTSEITSYGNWYVGEDWHSFDLQIPGRMVTNGGGVYPNLGDFKAPSGTVDAGSQRVLPITVKSLKNAKEAYIYTEWNQTIINVTSVSLNATAQAAGVTLNDWDLYRYEAFGYLYAYIGNMSNLNTASWTPLLDLTVKANATSGRTPMNISGNLYMFPRENVEIMYRPALLENGQISITAPNKADLRAVLLDPPQYVKKYADGSLHFDQTMIIENIGSKAVTEDFKVEARFGSTSEAFTITGGIAPGANITYYMTMNVVPGYGKTEVSVTQE
ncbi:MAG: hypothetical protein GX879_12220, partial [Bacteroidales bacterium]|nr:hypothetical protein [Bacteroidales bacterium]